MVNLSRFPWSGGPAVVKAVFRWLPVAPRWCKFVSGACRWPRGGSRFFRCLPLLPAGCRWLRCTVLLLLVPRRALFFASWNLLGYILDLLELTLGLLGLILDLWKAPGAHCWPPGASSGRLGHILGPSWSLLMVTLGPLVAILKPLEPSEGIYFGSILDHFRSLLASFPTYSRPNFRPQRLLCIDVCVLCYCI